jgi:hypothetical protein
VLDGWRWLRGLIGEILNARLTGRRIVAFTWVERRWSRKTQGIRPMISTILFTLSAVCFGAMMMPSKKLTKTMRPMTQIYTYSVCDAKPMPTWKRKSAPKVRANEMAR